MAELHVVVPGLCGPFPKDVEITDNDVIQKLTSLLANADERPAADSFYEQLCRCTGIASPLPAAALSLLAESEEYISKNCMHCAPVHLQADMDHAILLDEYSLELDADEKTDFFGELKAYLAEDGIQLTVSPGGEWFFIDESADISTTPLHDVIGRNINFHLPSGSDAAKWKRVLNESQMLMHMSPANVDREQCGKLTVNSVWLWGQGKLQSVGRDCQYTRIYGDSNLAKGLAVYCKCEYGTVSESSNIGSDLMAAGDKVLVCDTGLMSVVSYADYERWLEGVNRTLDEVLLPLMAASRQNNAAVTIYPCNGISYELKPLNWLESIIHRFTATKDPGDFISRDN